MFLPAELVLTLALCRHAPLHLALGGKLPCGQDLLLREEREAAKHAVGQARHEVGLHAHDLRSQALDHHVQADNRGHDHERRQDHLGLADVGQVVLAHQPHKEPQVEGIDDCRGHKRGAWPGEHGLACRDQQRGDEVVGAADEVLPDIARRAAEEGLPGGDAPDQQDGDEGGGERDGKREHEQRRAAANGRTSQGFLHQLTGIEDSHGQKHPGAAVSPALEAKAQRNRAGRQLQEERGDQRYRRRQAHLLPPR